MSDAPAIRPVLIMAGGTGGHIFPGLAVAEVLRARGVRVAWLGARGGMESELVPARGFVMHAVPVSGLRGKGWRARLLAPWMLLRALWATWSVLRRERPARVLSMGGFAAGPGGVVAWLQHRPLLVHEQNRVPGLTNRLLARLARTVMAGFADAFPASRKARWVGNPVRADIAAVRPPEERLAARTGRPRLLVLGGSLGARALNLTVAEALRGWPPEARPEICHQAGRRGLDEARGAYAEAGVEAEVRSFIEDMAAAYAWADLVLCRAGALTLAELCAVGVGSVLVPYPHAVDDHQTRNAEGLARVGGARVLAQGDMNGAGLSAQLEPLLADRVRLLAMARAARALAKPDAAAVIADICMEEGA